LVDKDNKDDRDKNLFQPRSDAESITGMLECTDLPDRRWKRILVTAKTFKLSLQLLPHPTLWQDGCYRHGLESWGLDREMIAGGDGQAMCYKGC
jgi:hypothetical protein